MQLECEGLKVSVSNQVITIHPSAVVSAKATLGQGVFIGPHCVVEEDVVLGDNCRLDSHVVIGSGSVFGKDNRFFPFASLGLEPPDVKFKGEKSNLHVGDANVFREGVTVHRGTEGGGRLTKIGSDNLLLPYVHIAHDCQVGNQNILVNNTSLAGHVQIGSYTNLAGYTLVSPFNKIGDFVHTSAGSLITKHVPCFLRLSNHPVKALGLNKVGLQRSGLFTQDELNALMRAYRMIYKKGCLLSEAKAQLQASEDHQLYAVVRKFCQSLSGGDKGVIR